ncbi:flavodoxin domain-containing protein [Nocardia pseudobrasiliensis]|uniref:Menaquinone-dependent protoporphyrinogen oxidase n=1 Tax=Nocardia pseudobrasiliensis TaxID=45979 RepID=A0A370HPH6_9NOCA|nr:flavodoxin domain-containing protein [Nocardia pseudobrasiliensis]RDI60483.1 menaquinone-dependent protoporphyrinogen oxidase [Nocardia pseudobrasiliensis]
MTRETVLVVYGSERGGTAEIAQWIGDALHQAHLSAEVKSAREVRSLGGYGAVILGGALYSGLWHRHARGFARRFTRQLRERPVWVFGSGPLDHSADQANPEKIFGAGAVRKAAQRLNARDYTIFGGRLERDARGFIASAMAKNQAGDYRDRDRIRAWAKGIADELSRAP